MNCVRARAPRVPFTFPCYAPKQYDKLYIFASLRQFRTSGQPKMPFFYSQKAFFNHKHKKRACALVHQKRIRNKSRNCQYY